MTPASLQTLWARMVVDALVRSGVTNLVLSPGSRSTPLAFAALETESLCTHAIVDERCAGFFALGLAKAAGKPVALVCTSGSAMTHYFPAMVEASQDGVPLVVLSADRPPELQHTACAQTVDQTKLFGSFVRFQANLGPPEERADALRLTARLVAQAVARSVGSAPGPTHLNVPLRKPLAPETRRVQSDDVERLGYTETLHGLFPAVPAKVVATDEVLSHLAHQLREAPCGLIALGPGLCPRELEPELVRELASVSGLPVLAETASGARLDSGIQGYPLLCDAVDHVLEHVAGPKSGPLSVLQLGSPLVTSSYGRMLNEAPNLELHVLSAREWADPSGRAITVTRAALEDSVRRLCTALRRANAAPRAPRRDWENRLRRHNARWWTAVDEVLGTRAAPNTPLGEPEAARAVLAALPSGSVLALGNSLPVREVDWFSPAFPRDVRVFPQRGANGIDGALSGAAGIATALGRPMAALIGDLTFLHDLGGLAVAARASTPTALVVLNNSGGRIFEHLPLGDLASSDGLLEAGWLLPQRLDIGALASGFGLRFTSITGAADIAPALAEAFSYPKASVLELVVSPRSTRETLAAVRRAARELEG